MWFFPSETIWLVNKIDQILEFVVLELVLVIKDFKPELLYSKIQISNYIFYENFPFFPLILDISRAKTQKHLYDFEYCVYLMVGVSVNIKYSYHVINVKQYLRTPVHCTGP